MYDKYPFSLKPLNYALDALEPFIDAQTMATHHGKHLNTYVDKLNAALENHPEYHSWTLDDLVRDYAKLPDAIKTAVRNNGGGVYNHNFYFDIMTPEKYTQPKGALAEQINQDFGSYDNFIEQFKNAALNTFGSGFAWLVKDDKGTLSIVSKPNQDTPLPDGLIPIMLIDVWEHAYYLKYKNLRLDYINNWLYIIDWNKVSENYIKF